MHHHRTAMQQLCLQLLMLALVTQTCIAMNVHEAAASVDANAPSGNEIFGASAAAQAAESKWVHAGDVPLQEQLGLLSQKGEIAAATRAICEIKGTQVTGHQAWCLKSDFCTAAGGVIKGIDGKCHYPGVKEDNDVELNEDVEETLKGKTKSDMPMVSSEKAGEILVEIYQSTGLSDEKVFDTLGKGIFTYTQASTVFVLIGKRFDTVKHTKSRNSFFHWKNAHDEENIYPFFREVQNFTNIVVVLDGPTAQLDGFVKALKMFPFANEEDWRKKCDVPKISINYSSLAELFLRANSQFFLNDWWWWFNEDAVDFAPAAMTRFQVTEEYEKAMKAYFTAMNTVRQIDTLTWDKKVCAAWGEHFKSLQAGKNANPEGCEVTQIDGIDIQANVKRRTELDIDPDWMENFPKMICKRLRMQESKTVCVPVFGKRNTDCEFSVAAMWQTATIEFEIRRSKYNRKTSTKYIQTMFCVSVFLCVVFLCVQLVRFGYSKFTTHINDASKPRKKSMDSESTDEENDNQVDGVDVVEKVETRARAKKKGRQNQARAKSPGGR